MDTARPTSAGYVVGAQSRLSPPSNLRGSVQVQSGGLFSAETPIIPPFPALASQKQWHPGTRFVLERRL